MLVTPEEARDKYCPFRHSKVAALISKNGGTDYNCIAEQCMMWRWLKVPEDGRRPSIGFCGLAGRPLSSEEIEDDGYDGDLLPPPGCIPSM